MTKRSLAKNFKSNSLSKTIKQETLSYIGKMNGEGVSNLHNLFISEVEKSLISAVLGHLGGNVTKTAGFLGINRGTLIKKIKDYGLND
ncbi:MAG: Fis family transcriptional regulator [Pelagibacterales bacterium]|nr:Fis family transcriptional regulator [Pelagibacterales bacterium]|tara:strand:- start:2073 stop:2336 length:264 start_codon:yes stop_codon:yes gene_type:complete